MHTGHCKMNWMPREYRFQGGVWVPARRAGATILVSFTCQAVDFNDAHNQLDAYLDEIYGDEWNGWIAEFDGFLQEDGSHWDWDFMREVRANPTTQRIERHQGTAATIADILGVGAEQIEVI